MPESMEQLIRQLDLLPRGCSVLCAVSGGADSVCLLHALYRLRPRLGFRLAAAHFNHNLRGQDSDLDAVFVRQFVELCCGRQTAEDGTPLPAVPLFVGSGDVAAYAAEQGMGLEEAGRELRYRFLRQTAAEIGADRIATAHNANDNAETVLLHLARGSGLRGLGGIAPQRDDLIRPLLTTTRQEIEAYLSFYALPHREDASNYDDAYSRNRIRHQVMPVLEGLYPGFAARMGETAARLRADEACLCETAQTIADTAFPLENGLSISAASIAAAPDPIALRAVRLLIGRFNGGDQDCAAVHLHAVAALCRGSDPSGEVHLPYGLVARREYGQLILSLRQEREPLSPTSLSMPGQTLFGSRLVCCEDEVYAWQPQTPYEFWLCRESTPSLLSRSRQTGDRLTLPGRPCKSVKKWLIDEKIPRLERDSLPLFLCGDQVAAVAGLGPDAAFLPQPGQRAWHITVTPCPERFDSEQ